MVFLKTMESVTNELPDESSSMDSWSSVGRKALECDVYKYCIVSRMSSLGVSVPLPPLSCVPPSRPFSPGLLWHDWGGDVLRSLHWPALCSVWPGPAPPEEARHPDRPQHSGQAPSAAAAVSLRHPGPGLPTPVPSLDRTLEPQPFLLQSAVSAAPGWFSAAILRGSAGCQVGLNVEQEWWGCLSAWHVDGDCASSFILSQKSWLKYFPNFKWCFTTKLQLSFHIEYTIKLSSMHGWRVCSYRFFKSVPCSWGSFTEWQSVSQLSCCAFCFHSYPSWFDLPPPPYLPDADCSPHTAPDLPPYEACVERPETTPHDSPAQSPLRD